MKNFSHRRQDACRPEVTVWIEVGVGGRWELWKWNGVAYDGRAREFGVLKQILIEYYATTDVLPGNLILHGAESILRS
jgi:hypothetical protein